MQGELSEFYGQRVHIFYKDKWTQEASCVGSSVKQSFSGLEGTLERDTENFVFLRDVKHKIVERAVRADTELQLRSIVAKSMIGGISPENNK